MNLSLEKGFLDTFDEATRMRGMTCSAFVQKEATREFLEPACNGTVVRWRVSEKWRRRVILPAGSPHLQVMERSGRRVLWAAGGGFPSFGRASRHAQPLALVLGDDRIQEGIATVKLACGRIE